MRIGPALFASTVLLSTSCSGNTQDDCTLVKNKIRPLLANLARDANKPMSPEQREQLLAGFCPTKDTPPAERELFECVRVAADQPAAAACLQRAFEDYRGAVGEVAPQPRTDAFDASVHATAVDAGVIDAGVVQRVVTPVDPHTLPQWQAPDAPRRGRPVVIQAVEMDADLLLVNFATGALVMLPVNKQITGRVEATSQAAAFAAVANEVGVDVKPIKLGGRGTAVDLVFARAPGRDLVRLLGDIGRVNIVVRGSLPELDVAVKRVPWDGLLKRMVAVTGHELVASGNTRYVLPAGTKLPAKPKLSARPKVDLDVNGGTIAHALAALRTVTDVPLAACKSPAFSLRLRGVPLDEALRALSVVSGVTLAEGPACPAAPLAADIDDARLVAIAAAGASRVAAFD